MKRILVSVLFLLAMTTVAFGQYSNPRGAQDVKELQWQDAAPTAPPQTMVTVYTGSGINDVTVGGTFSGAATSYVDIIIDAAGTPDTFKWRRDGGSYTTGVSITGSAQTLEVGITVTFAATTGHILADAWSVSITPSSQYYFNSTGIFTTRNYAGTAVTYAPLAGAATHSTLTVTGATALNGGATATTVTASTGVQSAAVARTATSDGLTTGTIAAGTSFVSVTSANANNIIVLPVPVVGNRVTLAVAATGYELRTSTPASIAINGGTGSAAESAIGANVVTVCDCTSSTTWICTDRSSAGVVTPTEVAAP